MASRSSNPVVSDPDLPALEVLIGEGAEPFLASVLETVGSRLRSYRISQVRYLPSRSVTVQYRADVIAASGKPEDSTFVAMAGRKVPEGVPVFGAEGLEVAFWQYPNDPFLPGLPLATDEGRVSNLLVRLGAAKESIVLRQRAYRAGRRAVIEATGKTQRIFLKIVRPDAAAQLQKAHAELSEHIPVPHSLGWSEDQGIVAMQAMTGRTLRAALTARSTKVPSGSDILGLLSLLPVPDDNAKTVRGPHQRAPEHAELLTAVAPNLSDRLSYVVNRLDGLDTEPAAAVHGDFHSAQILIDRSKIVGVVDVDTAGVGERANDLAGLLGHLSTLALDLPAKKEIERYGSTLIHQFDQVVDPVGLRLRVAGVVLGLATGPFRVQERRWYDNTERRLSLAESWIASADAVK
ncbi:MAG: aminoglycoside phosphotransferase family protein [Acidimicrobiia bacterium]|nr:aminoglycoside phosphotransferase family protein [Acidimicrobiia bacterium]MDH3464137.1 aminoglycoside phosphotransferase family protein [Acidimicrobiia bacterium]